MLMAHGQRYRKTGALDSNMTSNFKPEVEIWSKLCMRSEKVAKVGEKQHQMAKIFAYYRKSGSLNAFRSGDKFATGNRISALTAHVQTLSSQKSPKTVSCA